ncbi:MAG: hypothetical protein K6E51_05140 [Treponema sp.]|nr:hypothetical protein [Treponema sp.]
MATPVTLHNGILELDSFLDEAQFSKTNVSSVMKEEGLIATWSDKQNNGQYTFTPWHCTATKKLDSGHIAYTASLSQFSIDSGVDLPTLLAQDREKAQGASFAICTALQQLQNVNPSFNVCGAGGIIICNNANQTRYPTLLFLPYNSFDTFLHGSPDYFTLQAAYQHPYASGTQAINYTASTIAYQALSGELPYTNPDTYNTDVMDSNCIPLIYRINGINNALSQAIQQGLAYKPADQTLPLPLLQTELGIQKDGSIICYPRQKLLSDEVFLQQSAKACTKQKTRIKRLRFFRTYKTKLITAAVIIAIVCIASHNYIQANKNRPSSIGLSPLQVVQAYYEGINTQNAELMQAMAQGNKANTYLSSVTTLFITGKIRQAYEGIASPIPPSLWMIHGAKQEQPIFGLSGLSVNGKPLSLSDTEIPTRGNHPQPLAQPSTLTQNYSVSYYLWYTQNDHIMIQLYHDDIIVTYTHNAWHITQIDGTVKEIPVDSSFFDTVQSTLIQTHGDVQAATNVLHKLYPWFPTNQELSRYMQ